MPTTHALISTMVHYLHQTIKKLTHLLLVSVSVTAGCGRASLVSPEKAFRETSSSHVEISDDLNFAGLVDAIAQQQNVLKKSGDTLMKFGDRQISRKEYGAVLQKLSEILASQQPEWGEILLTSYFEPIIPGSITKTERFSQALYARPEDLVVIDLKKFAERFKDESTLRGRLNESRVIPYYSRHEIDDEGVLKGKNLELCWVDPTDAFFLQIQGSGTVQLPHGEEIFITYAEKNGLKYEPIGKFLKEQLAPLPVTMQRIEGVVKTMTSQERSSLFAKNPSYVFFTKSQRRAITSLGIPATPGRTIAADSKYAPKGALALVTFNKPDLASPVLAKTGMPPTHRVSRFVLDQDSGGAITGTDHIDLFWGRGDEAKKVAGILQDRASIVYLFPK